MKKQNLYLENTKIHDMKQFSWCGFWDSRTRLAQQTYDQKNKITEQSAASYDERSQQMLLDPNRLQKLTNSLVTSPEWPECIF